jgi:hypothetical protein
MPTFTQAILLGADRLGTPPPAPHAVLAEAWTQLDWTGAKDTALLEASALLGTARGAGALVAGPFAAPAVAPSEAQTLVSPRAIALLHQLLLTDDLRELLPEWIELCAQHDRRVPPFFLPQLFAACTALAERTALLRVIGERGRWLAAQNSAWGWVGAAAPAPALALWEVGSEDERLAALRQARATDPAHAAALLEKTWGEDSAEFRLRALAIFLPTLSLADEPLLTRALTDRRKEIRVAAQSALASLPASALAGRMRIRAEALLTCSRGLLGRKLEIALPAAFDPAWKADAVEEKPPAGVGEKAHWTQQILALVPFSHWTEKFELDPAALVDLAQKSSDWGDLLLGAWFRAACVHREPAAASALLRPVIARPQALGAGTPHTAATALLAVCPEAARWRLATTEADLAWTILPLLTTVPDLATGRAFFEHLWRSLRDGFNPGGSPTAVLAARRLPPALRDEAARRLARENEAGLTKPADAFLRALEFRAELHAAFARLS